MQDLLECVIDHWEEIVHGLTATISAAKLWVNLRDRHKKPSRLGKEGSDKR